MEENPKLTKLCQYHYLTQNLFQEPPTAGGFSIDAGGTPITYAVSSIENVNFADSISAYVDAIFVSDSSRNLGRYDATTDEFTLIGQTQQTLTDVAISPDGRLFGTTFDGLFEVDPVTAETTLIGNYGRSNMNALAFLPDGRLLGAAEIGNVLYEIDLDTAQLTVLGGTGFSSAGDLVFHESELLLAANGDDFVELDLDELPLGRTVKGELFTFGLASLGTDQLFASQGPNIFAVDDETLGLTLAENLSTHGITQIFGMTSINEVTIAGLLQ